MLCAIVPDSFFLYSLIHLRFIAPFIPWQIWDQSVETVMSKEPTQCYAINADMFFDNFREELGVMRTNGGATHHKRPS